MVKPKAIEKQKAEETPKPKATIEKPKVVETPKPKAMEKKEIPKGFSASF